MFFKKYSHNFIVLAYNLIQVYTTKLLAVIVDAEGKILFRLENEQGKLLCHYNSLKNR